METIRLDRFCFFGKKKKRGGGRCGIRLRKKERKAAMARMHDDTNK